MHSLYRDLLEGFKEIGEIENNKELVDQANNYLSELNNKEAIQGSCSTCTSQRSDQ